MTEHRRMFTVSCQKVGSTTGAHCGYCASTDYAQAHGQHQQPQHQHQHYPYLTQVPKAGREGDLPANYDREQKLWLS